MTGHTEIEWTHMPGFKGESWNPIAGCKVLTKGCTNCYAMRQAKRIIAMTGGESHYNGTVEEVNGKPVWNGAVNRAPHKTLEAPLRARKPRCYFVNSMADLFYEGVPDEWIDRIFAVMALAPQHRFLILTKRADRMRKYLTDEWLEARVSAEAEYLDEKLGLTDPLARHTGDGRAAYRSVGVDDGGPLPNVWLGVSVEDQAQAEARIPALLATPAAKRFISAEPLLGPVDLQRIPFDKLERDECGAEECCGGQLYQSALEGGMAYCDGPVDGEAVNAQRIDWVIAGGESGPDARPCHPDWIRTLRDQCQAADVPFFFKQWGEWRHSPETAHFKPDDPRLWCRVSSNRDGVRPAYMVRYGKKASGNQLDGAFHLEFPEEEAAS